MTNTVEKQFKLRQPCSNCPFIKGSGSIELMPGRRYGIIEDLIKGSSTTFHCHKTVYREDGRNHDAEGNYKPVDIAHCPGAMAVAMKCGATPTVIQIAERFGIISGQHYEDAKSSTLSPEEIAEDAGKDVNGLYHPFSR